MKRWLFNLLFGEIVEEYKSRTANYEQIIEGLQIQLSINNFEKLNPSTKQKIREIRNMRVK